MHQQPSYILHYYNALIQGFKPLTLRQWQALTARLSTS